MNYGNIYLIHLRYILSIIGILKILKIIIGIFKKEYEKKYSEAIFKNIENNFRIWDVGANRGYYIRKFLKINKGNSVIAFEPTPYLYKFLKYKFSTSIKNKKLFVYNYALADKSKKTFFWVSKKKKNSSVTNSLSYHPDKIKVPVNQKKPDELITKKKLKIPNLIKLDIEGGELKFLEGSKKILKYKALRHLFIEVHFTKLNKLYGKNSVKKIIKILKNSDFKIFWTDSSHLHAKKIYK